MSVFLATKYTQNFIIFNRTFYNKNRFSKILFINKHISCDYFLSNYCFLGHVTDFRNAPSSHKTKTSTIHNITQSYS